MPLNNAVFDCLKKYDNFYLYDESVIVASLNRLKANFPQVDFLYSIKCNSNPNVLRSILGRGLGAEPLFTSKDAFRFLTLKDDTLSETVTLVGNLCTNTDIIAENVRLPYLECGDAVIITNAGSYAAVLSPMQFSTQEKPKELFLKQSGEVI